MNASRLSDPNLSELLVLTFVAAGSLFAPATLAGRLPSFCLTYHLFGRRCPGCGMTRAFIAVGHGHIGEAMQLNKFSVIVYALWLSLSLTQWIGWILVR